MSISPPSGGGGFITGQYVMHSQRSDWGMGQVQSVDGTRVTVNFENAGKQLINTAIVTLIPTNIDSGIDSDR